MTRFVLGMVLALACGVRPVTAAEAAAATPAATPEAAPAAGARVAAPAASAPAVSAPAASAPAAASKPSAPGRAPGVSQSVRGDNVLIEGKLYSPQALFIVTRRTETFGRDAIVPTYLDVRPDAAFLPYRLRADRLAAPATATADSGATAPGTAR